MRVLVVGCGSIGNRHLRNLRALDVDQLAVVEKDAARREVATREIAIQPFSELTQGLEWGPDAIVIASPTHLHIAHALEVVSQGRALFIEKPLSHSAEGIADLLQTAEEKKLTTLVGCNMRFHPGPAKVKELLERGCLGKILFARIHAGSYLPAWRPGIDYRTNYAAREETGGGCILDGIHEIDLARWYLGDVCEVCCTAGHLSSLEIETEDVATLVLRHLSGAVSEVHLDYVQRTYERGCQIAGEIGSVFWDFRERAVRWYDAASDQWTTLEQPPSWQLNDMYVDEMRHFLQCVAEKKETVQTVREAASVMSIALAAKKSMREKTVVGLRGFV